MYKDDYKFVRQVLILSADHEPEGWPAIKMKDLMEASNSIKTLSRMLDMVSDNWVETHLHFEKQYIQHFGVPEQHMQIDEMFDKLMSLIPAPNPSDQGPASAGPL